MSGLSQSAYFCLERITLGERKFVFQRSERMENGDHDMVKVNGTLQAIEGSTLSEYLSSTDYQLNFIAVERNGEIVPKSDYASTVLCDGDTVEIVSFVGGG